MKKKSNYDRNEIDLNITNINEDCKEYIFQYLEWMDLLNVADCSKLFHTAVGFVLKKKYHKAYVTFGNCENRE